MIWSAARGNIGAVPFRGSPEGYGIDRLVYFETIVEPAAAVAREKQIKDYARVKKIAMINSVNPEWNDLAELWFADVSRNDPSLRSG